MLSKGDGKATLLLGLSHENLKRLREGLPIVIKAAELQIEETLVEQIFIFSGENEDTMLEEFRKRGLIGPDTIQADTRNPNGNAGS